VPRFAKCLTLGKEVLLPNARHSAKPSLPSAALGKVALYRVPDIWHSAKHMALGKDAISGSGTYIVSLRIYTNNL
jgi:hypothetical protein